MNIGSINRVFRREFRSAARMRPRTGAVLAVLTLAGSAALTGGVAQADTTAPYANGVSIDAGGAASGGFIADTDYTPSLTDTLPSGVDSDPNFPATVANPIPAAVWDSQRYLETNYTIPGFTPGASYQVRLYFMDWYFTSPGQREFDVDINGTPVLTDFDVIGTADAAGADGQEAFGVERDFTVDADSTGTIAIDFIQGSANQPLVNAIAVVPSS